MDKFFKSKDVIKFAETLKKEGKVLRMGASIKDGKVSVGMMEVTQDDPLYSIRGGENAFVFYTERYQPIPLTLHCSFEIKQIFQSLQNSLGPL